ncbi:hypothetical protein MRX96_024192 [Rhipicephalus microplus]
MIFSSTCNFSAVAAVVLLTPLSWPFVLCFSCRVATWMYRLYLIALVAIVAFATCCPSRRQDLVNDMYRYSGAARLRRGHPGRGAASRKQKRGQLGLSRL